MPRRKTDMSEDELDELIPTLTPADAEKLGVTYAYNLAFRRLRNGTASSQEVVYFLKLGSTLAGLEKERLEHENKLLEEKTLASEAARFNDHALKELIEAVKGYRVNSDNDDDEDIV